MKSFRCSLKDSLCLLLGSEVNAITWLVFLTLHRNQSGCSFSHPHCPPPPRGVMQTEAALSPRHPGDITALVKQKRNPACGSCSLKKISAVRPHRGKYISIWLKVAFIVKYVGGKKMFFYTVSFPSAVWCFSRMPWSWVPDIYFARENLLRTCLWTSNAVLRARESETEGGREKKTLPHCGTPEALQARTPAIPSPQNFLVKPAEVSAQWMLLCCKKRQALWSHIHFHQDAWRLDWPCSGPPHTHWQTLVEKSICTSLLRNTSCNSNDKVITET